MSRLPARTGREWLKQGFGLFRQQPGILTMLLFTNLMAGLLITQVPVAGAVVVMVLIPSFSIAVMQACNLIAQGQRVMPDVFLTGFRAPALLPLCKLGLVYVAVYLLMEGLKRLAGYDEFIKHIAAVSAVAQANPNARPAIDGALVMSVLAVQLLEALILLAMAFAAPLTYWKKMPTFKAIFYSVFGVFGAALPMLVLILLWFGIFMFTIMVVKLLFSGNMMLLQAVITWASMMLLLVLQCSIFASYRQIFSDPTPGSAPVTLVKPD